MSILYVGPDGLLMIVAMIVSVLMAALSWRRVRFSISALVSIVLAGMCGVWFATLPTTNHPLIVGLFVIVPTALLLGLSRSTWIARHSWSLVLAGPVIFVGCYVGICEVCLRTGLIS